MPPIRLSRHAQLQAQLRGANESEIRETLEIGIRAKAKRDKWSAVHSFPFDAHSPVNNKPYRFKTVDVIFVEEYGEIIVITVKVYYHNEPATGA